MTLCGATGVFGAKLLIWSKIGDFDALLSPLDDYVGWGGRGDFAVRTPWVRFFKSGIGFAAAPGKAPR
jgi:hypothetical protein